VIDLEDRFVGSLLGLALGDALGAWHEGGPFGAALWWALGVGKRGILRWSDDTEMAMGLSKSLIENRGLNPNHLAQTWAENADWKRGYASGARKLLARIRDGADWRVANRSVFPDGSFGNGAAMRAAPLGLFFHKNQAELVRETEIASSITHAHPLGIEGGVLIARATAMALSGPLDLDSLREGCREREYRDRLKAAKVQMDRKDVKRRLGNSVEAHRSSVTAVYLAAHFDEFVPMMKLIVSLGGDTDTIGAMAGGIFGARYGTSALPKDALEKLEERGWIEKTAKQLFNLAGKR
jgi:poly(ADP-ribose) glycohydrolase ARH3